MLVTPGDLLRHEQLQLDMVGQPLIPIILSEEFWHDDTPLLLRRGSEHKSIKAQLFNRVLHSFNRSAERPVMHPPSLANAEIGGHNLRKWCGECRHISMNWPIGPIFDGIKAESLGNWQRSGCGKGG